MKKTLCAVALLLAGTTASAAETMNAPTRQLLKAIVSNCVESKAIEENDFDKQAILESYVTHFCEIKNSGNVIAQKNSKSFFNLLADGAELKVIHAGCIASAVEGRFVNGPRETKGVKLDVAMNALSDLAAKKVSDENPCFAPAMCGDGKSAIDSKKACHAYMDADALRRTADQIGTASYPADSRDPAREQIVEGERSVLSESALASMMARGHMKIPNQSKQENP